MIEDKNILIEHMTTNQVQDFLKSGVTRVILTSGSMEQHGPHLPINTDYILAKHLAIKAAKNIGNTLVAPVIPIGCADHHMSFAGTISSQKEVFIEYLKNAASSLVQHGFCQILVATFHGGNFGPSHQAIKSLREQHASVDFREALDLKSLFSVTNGVMRKFFPSRTALDCHAGCAEVSMMYHLNPDYVKKEHIVNGGELTEFPEQLINFKDISPTGVIGITDGYSAEIGEELCNRVVQWMIKSWGVS